MNSTLASLQGMDYYLVQRALRRLGRLHTTADRRALLERIEAEDGRHIRKLVEAAFREEWDRRLAAQRAEDAAADVWVIE